MTVRASTARAALLSAVLAVGLVLATAHAAGAQARPPAPPSPPTGTAAPAPAAQPAPAQPVEDGRKWEFEVHGGFVLPSNSGGGTASLPTTGALVSGLISTSTFFFGDGARLFNENPARGAASPIVSLDPVVRSPAFARDRSLAIGVRLDRRLTRRLGVEIAGEYRRGRLGFRSDALAGIESTRASVKTALDGVLARFPVPSAITSTSTVLDDQRVTQLVATGALVVNLRETGRARPYIVVGGGVALNDVTSPRARLVGNYQLGSPAQILYTDGIELTVREDDRPFVGLGGGGVKLRLSPRWGVRLDGRAMLYKNTTVNLIAVGPGTLLQSTGQPFPILTAGTLQFSPLAPLTGSAQANVPTFTGSGLQTHIIVSAGLFLRF